MVQTVIVIEEIAHTQGKYLRPLTTGKNPH